MPRISHSDFKPANEEQIVAIELIRNFINAGDPDQYFTLQGKAGTGKTTIMQEAIAVVKKKQIIVGALSHKAKLVIASKLHQRFGKSKIKSETVASMLGMKMDMETGEFIMSKDSEFLDPPVSTADVIVIDECSMINEEALSLIMEHKRSSAKVIFLGDIGQLPPIRKNTSGYQDHPSPTFATEHSAFLTERIRQGEQSPILPYADLFWNNSQSASPIANPATKQYRKSTVTENGSLVFAKSANAFEKVFPLYKVAVEINNPDIVRTVVYRNNTRQLINRKIREFLFEDAEELQFVAGDLIMFQDNYSEDDLEIPNSTEIQIKSAIRRKTDDGWNAWQIGFALNGRPVEMLALDHQDESRFTAHLNTLGNRAKSMPFGRERIDAWGAFWSQKKRFAPIDYAYAITSHKAQGSTYDVTLIAEADIVTVPISDKSKSQSIYTAITRARHIAIIMDGANDHEELHIAIALLDKKLFVKSEPVLTEEKID